MSFSSYIRTPEFKDLLKRYEQALKDNSSVFFDADDLLDIAEYYNSIHEIDKSNAAAYYCLELYPDYSKAKVLIARSAIESGDVNFAQRIADELTYEDDLDSVYLKAELMLINSETEKAERYLRSYFDKLENGSDERYDMALDVPLMYCDYGIWSLAEEWLSTPEAQEQKEEMDYAEAMASVCTNIGRYKKAIPLWNQVIDEDPFFAHAWVQLAVCQCQAGQCHEALQSVQYALAIEPNYPDAYLAAGNAYYYVGNNSEAKKMFGRFLELMPGDAQGELLMATILFTEENYDEAQVYIDNAIFTLNNIVDKEVPYSIYCDIYSHAAFISSAKGDMKRAQEYVTELSRHGCPDNDVQLLRASVYLEGGCQEEAFDIFRTMLSREQCDTDTYIKIADMLIDSCYFELGRNVMLATFASLKNSGEGCTKGWDRMAYASLMTGHYDDFLTALEQAVIYLPVETTTIFSAYFPKDMPITEYVQYAKEHRIKISK